MSPLPATTMMLLKETVGLFLPILHHPPVLYPRGPCYGDSRIAWENMRSKQLVASSGCMSFVACRISSTQQPPARL
ncbi:transcription factor tfiiic complex a box associated subunit sfc1 [Histoplasma ohiense]|nr:transcription factor tfiiic complex a box associated subunit sfc1 [Histoplasma ohiense (nom. inval.)]